MKTEIQVAADDKTNAIENAKMIAQKRLGHDVYITSASPKEVENPPIIKGGQGRKDVYMKP